MQKIPITKVGRNFIAFKFLVSRHVVGNEKLNIFNKQLKEFQINFFEVKLQKFWN